MSNEEEPKPKTLGGIDRSAAPFWRSGNIINTDLYGGLTAENINALIEQSRDPVFGPAIEIVSAAEYARRIAKREEEILELKGEQPK
ncbi:MAG: hypothetical protein E6Q97_00885 [Desulfurellales bacterium]|nr:MAG: hypothetical protein E6Q97_00885 [Desulfurellales bacterium]